MNRYLVYLALAVLAGLTGCASPIPLNNITYDKAVTVTSTKVARVSVISGAVRGSGSSTLIPMGTTFIPIASGPNVALHFNAKDQQAFGESLRTELVRTGLLRTAYAGSGAQGTFRVGFMFDWFSTSGFLCDPSNETEAFVPTTCSASDREDEASHVGGVFSLIPALAVIGVIFSLYGLYLLYLGLTPVMKSPEQKTVAYTAVIVVIAVVIWVIIGVIVGAVMASFIGAAALATATV